MPSLDFITQQKTFMKHTFKTLMATLILALALSTTANAGGSTNIPPDKSSPELQRIKSLAGRWTTVTSMFGKKNQRLYTEYQVTAAGSAVLERIFPDTPYEMVSMYYDDDHGKLAMTHYCIMHNRPTLKLASISPDTITMDVKKVEGLKSKKDPSMGGMTLHFKDKNHFETTCKGRGKGKEKEEPMTMAYTRVR